MHTAPLGLSLWGRGDLPHRDSGEGSVDSGHRSARGPGDLAGTLSLTLEADTGNGSSGQVTSGSAAAAASPRPLPEPATVEASLPSACSPRGREEETDTDRAVSSSRCRYKQRTWSEISEDTQIWGTLRVLTLEVPGLRETGSVRLIYTGTWDTARVVEWERKTNCWNICKKKLRTEGFGGWQGCWIKEKEAVSKEVQRHVSRNSGVIHKSENKPLEN